MINGSTKKSEKKFKFLEIKWKHSATKPMGCSKRNTKRNFYNNQCIFKTTVNDLSLCLKELKNFKKSNAKIGKRKEVIQLFEEVNDTETKWIMKEQ